MRTAPPKEEDTSAADAAAAMGYGLGGGMMGNDMLMIGNGGAYGGGYGGGYGGASSIPDPYQQAPQYGGGYGGGNMQVQGYGGSGGYY